MAKNNKSNKFPHVVIRWQACFYGQIPVRFVNKKPHDLPSSPRQGAREIIVFNSKPFCNDKYPLIERLTKKARLQLIETVKSNVKDTGFRMCVVFGSEDAVFVEPDGSANQSTNPPSGGLRMDTVEVVKPGDQ